MGFLQKLLKYKKICIQCHDNPDPDAIASAFGVQHYLNHNGIESRIIYGGEQEITKTNLKILLKECGIEIEKTDKIEEDEFLVLVDGQKGQMNMYVAHSNCPEKAEAFAQQLREEFPNIPLTFIDPLALSISCHIGSGSLAVAMARTF